MMTPAEEMAGHIERAARALSAAVTVWHEHDLPGDFSTPETGYPFTESLDEVTARVWEWAHVLRSTDGIRQ